MSKKPRRVYHPGSSPFASPKAVVQQHLKQDSDINQIVAKARRGITPTNLRPGGVFADVSKMPSDLTEAFATVETAWESFMELPAKAREELNNDPRRLTKANADFFKRHGLLNPPKEAPGSSQEPLPGSGGVAPVKKAAKQPKAASAASNSDQDDQE